MSSQYQRGSIGHVLHFLREWGIPETIAGSVTVGQLIGSRDVAQGLSGIFYGRQLFAEYKYFTGIEQPLFRFHQHTESYSAQWMEIQQDRSLRPKFRLMLGPHNDAALIIQGHPATPELYEFLMSECLTNLIAKPGYRIHKDAGAFFQGGYDKPDGQWFYIEFSRSDKAQVFVDFVNDNYRPTRKENE